MNALMLYKRWGVDAVAGEAVDTSNPTVTITSGTSSDTDHYLLTGTAEDDEGVVTLEYELNAGGDQALLTEDHPAPLPGLARGDFGWNGSSHAQDTVTTASGAQYAVWVAADKTPMISKRTLPNGLWSSFDLSTVSGNPLGAMGDDSHNLLTVAVDSNGFIHVSGNHHNDALNYIRSDNANDITAWSSASMVGSDEDQVTYPRFVVLSDGTLLFFYRQFDGDYKTILNTYDPSTTSWSRTATILQDGSERPYLWHVAVDWSNNDLHLIWCWRANSGGANTANDLCYATSTDKGATWKKSDGSTYTLPIDHASSELAVDTASTDSGLVNQCGAEVDDQGRPHAAIFLYDGSGDTQLHHVWHDGSSWHNDQVTSWTYTYVTDSGTLTGDLMRPSVFTYGSRAFILYRHNVMNDGQVRCVEVTPGIAAYEDFLILEQDLHEGELTFDTRALKEREEVHCLVCPLVKHGSSSEHYADEEYWVDQPARVLTIDLADIDEYLNELRKAA